MSANDLEQFDQWTLSIGNGELKEIPLTDEMISTIITKNSKDNPNSELGAMSRFIDEIFPNVSDNISDPNWLEG